MKKTEGKSQIMSILLRVYAFGSMLFTFLMLTNIAFPVYRTASKPFLGLILSSLLIGIIHELFINRGRPWSQLGKK